MRALRLAILSAVLAATRVASAQSHPTAVLEYARDAGAARCPDDAAVRAAVIARLGYDPFTGAAASTTRVRASITRQGRALRASIELHRANASRPGRPREITSHAGDCDELARAMCLAIGIAIDPLVLTRPAPAPDAVTGSTGVATVGSDGAAGAVASSGSTSSPSRSIVSPSGGNPPRPIAPSGAPNAPSGAPNAPSTTPGAPSVPPTPPSRRPLPLARRPNTDPLRLRVGLGLEGQFGFEPFVAPGARLVLGGRIRRFGVDIELRGALPNATSYMGGTVSVGHAGAVALACAHEIPVPWLTACALVAGSVLYGTGTGYPAPQLAGTTRVLGPLVGLGARLGVEIPLGRLVALFANGEIAWVPTRGTFQIAPAASTAQALTAYSTPGYDVVAGAGVLVHFR